MQPVDDDNPYAAPADDRGQTASLPNPGDPVVSCEVKDMFNNKEEWTATVYPEYLRFTREGEVDVDVQRSDIFDNANVHESGPLQRSVSVKVEKKARGFMFSEEDFANVTGWLNPLRVEDLRRVLNKRFSIMVMLAMMITLLFLPLQGNPAAGIAMPRFALVGLPFGLSLLCVTIVSRFVAHRAILLVYALCFATFAALHIYRLVFDEVSWFMVLFVFFWGLVALNAWRQFRRFAHMEPARPE